MENSLIADKDHRDSGANYGTHFDSEYELFRKTSNGYIVRSNSNWSWIVESGHESQISGARTSPPSPDPTSLPSLHIITLTNRCNHACRYCQVETKYSTETEGASSVMVKNLDGIAEYAVENSPDSFSVEFQGGEPLLAWESLIYLVDKISDLCKKISKIVRFRIVSNLTCLTDNIIDFCIANRITIATSLDGLRSLHIRHRKFPETKEGSYNLVLSGIRKLKEAGVRVNVLTVVTVDSLPYATEIVDNFAELGIYSFFMKPVYPLGWARNDYENLTGSKYDFGAFLKRVLKRCMDYHDVEFPIYESFSGILLKKILRGFEPNFVDLRSPCGALNGQIAYDTEGKVYTCDEARFGSGKPVGTLGNSIKELKETDFSTKILKDSVTSKSVCGTCAYRPWCGRCPIMNLHEGLPFGVKSHETTYCKTMLGAFDTIFELIAEEPKRIERYLKVIELSELLNTK